MNTQTRRPGSMCALLPAAPLVAAVEGRGGLGACLPGSRKSPAYWGVERAWERAQARGWLTVRAADELAIRVLGLHPMLVWGDDWLIRET